MNMHNGFLIFDRQESIYRDIQERVQDWNEIVDGKSQANLEFKKNIAKQATRCMDCGVPFCQSDVTKSIGCPVENLIPDWSRLISINDMGLSHFSSEKISENIFLDEKKWKQALELLHLTNNFPEFTGKLCPAPCESACILGINEKPVSIKAIESALVENGFEKGWITAVPTQEIKEQKMKEGTCLNVAIIGSGPAGLAAAQQLVRGGHQVTVFDKNEKPGGLLRYGIPGFKIEKHFIDRRLNQLIEEGVKFQCDSELGKDFTLNELKKRFDKIALTVGAEKPRDLNIPNRSLKGIHLAMEYLTDSSESISATGKNVIILGGGDTGADVLSTAIRQKAKSIRQLEIQSIPKNFKKPQSILEAESVYPFWQVDYNCQTLEFLSMDTATGAGAETGTGTGADADAGMNTNSNSKVTKESRVTHIRVQKGLDCVKQELWPADLVIIAVGFTGVKTEDTASEKIGFVKNNAEWMHLLNEKGVLETSSNYQTKDPQIFAAGDSRRGASLIVWAIHEGRQMAEQMMKDS